MHKGRRGRDTRARDRGGNKREARGLEIEGVIGEKQR